MSFFIKKINLIFAKKDFMRHLELRNSIFNLHTRQFGTVGEILTKTILEEFGFLVSKSDDLSYDLTINNNKDEVKCSRVLKKSKLDLESFNIVEVLLKGNNERFISLDNASNVEWDSNIQQIKPSLFKTLWYGLFFEDKVALFKIDSEQILKDENLNYSDKQHRGNVGEGQFHVTNKNVKYHLENYLVKTLTYEEVYEKLNQVNS